MSDDIEDCKLQQKELSKAVLKMDVLDSAGHFSAKVGKQLID